MPYTIYFSHGKDSGPKGNKIRYLKKIADDMNFKTISVDYTSTKNPDIRNEFLLKTYDKSDENIILYGSSMGAYVSIVASQIIKPKGLFLCAPALYLKGYKVQNFNELNTVVTIIHGNRDSVVPVENSIRFVKNTSYDLHIIEDDHSLSHSEDVISKLFEKFLKKMTN